MRRGLGRGEGEGEGGGGFRPEALQVTFKPFSSLNFSKKFRA